MINVYIISGFLGAGKTTLIQKMLSSMKDVMLIENEFGEVGVDAAFFNDNLKVTEINNGCICCSLKGDFKDALDDIRQYNVSNLIIEPSGVGKLSDIMPVILKEEDMRLVCHACVVDVKTAMKYHRNFKEYFDDQVIMANAIVLSHEDVATDEQIQNVKEMISVLNDEAEINEKPIQDYTNGELFDFLIRNVSLCAVCDDLDEDGCCCCHEGHEHHHHDHDHDHEHHHDHDHEHHHHHHDEPFETIAMHTKRIYSEEELKTMLQELDDSIIRCKGYVLSDDKTLYFNCVLDEINIFEGPMKEEGLIVLIGSSLDEEKWHKVFAYD